MSATGKSKSNKGKESDKSGPYVRKRPDNTKAAGKEKEIKSEEEDSSMITEEYEKRKAEENDGIAIMNQLLQESSQTNQAPGASPANTHNNEASGSEASNETSTDGAASSGGASGTGGDAPTDQPPSTTGETNAGPALDDIPIRTTETTGEGREDDPIDTKEERGEDEGNDDEDDDEDDDELRWSPTLNRKKAGLHKWDLRLEGKIKRWKQVKFVMADGPLNSVSYRIYKSQDMEEYDNPDAPNLKEGRIGEERDESGKITFRKQAKGIRAVAWIVDLDLLQRFPEEFPREEDLLKPRKRAADFPIIYKNLEEGNEEIKRMKIVECLVQIEFLINGTRHKTWETRSTAREIWGVEKADKGIYAAAKDQEERFRNWKKGKRPGKDQSATPGPTLTPERDTRSPTPGPSGKNVHFEEPGTGGKAPKMSLAAWRAEYCEMAELEFLRMTPPEKNEMMKAWRDYKNE